MSITSTLEINYLDDSEPIEISDIRDHVSGLLERDSVHIAALGGLEDAFYDGEAEIHVSPYYLLGLVEEIATLFPSISFAARGMEADFRSTWIREFRNGKITFSAGPWDDDDE